MASTINASTSPAAIVQTADGTANLSLQSNGTTIAALTSTGMAVTGTGSVSGDLSFNSGYGSSAVAYGCRAWVNFNGTSTVAIRASGNVTSITDNGTGDYTVNFTTVLVDANYCVVTSTQDLSGASNSQFLTLTTTSVRIYAITISPLVLADNAIVTVAIFR